MSKIKKLAFLCLMMLLGSLIITNSVNAESKYFSYEDLCKDESLLCAQHHQSMFGATYNLIATINIIGNKSTGNSTTVESWHNAKLAYILSQPRGQGNINGGDVEQLDVQNAIWNYLREWYTNVGVKHGIPNDFVGTAKGNYSTSIETKADNYANNYKEGTLTDKTNKDKIKVTSYTENNENYLRVGPFKYEFTGTLSDIKVITNKDTNVQIKSFEKCVKENQFSKYSKIEDIKSKDEFYISVKMPTDGSTQIKQIKVKNKTNVKHVTIKFWEHSGFSQQNLLQYTYKDDEAEIETPLTYDIKILGNLKVIKVDKNNETIRLSGVGFYIQNKDTGKYVNQATNGTISYVDSKEKATEFVTDKKGEIQIKNLIVGTYVAYETKNPNFGYEIISEGKEKTVTVDKTAELKIPNEQQYINLSGYVWVDRISGKQSLRNDLFKDNDNDSGDILLDGITVRLKDRQGNTIQETKTANGGAYSFKKVLIKELANYYIEFEYAGLTYTNVVPHTDKDNGSKAKEGTARTTFDNKFAEITADTTIDGTKLEYNSGNYTSTLINSGKFIITSTTKEAQFDISKQYKAGMTEIKNINLGLYEREQPDNAVVKDIENVRVSVNGYQHVYDYANRFANMDANENKFNVGVKFGNKYGTQTYTRAIYKSDYDYYDSNKNNELKVYVTYKITIKNESTNLTSKINSLLDYYDTKYTLEAAGTEVGKDGNITGTAIAHRTVNYNNDYNKSILAANITIDPQKEKDIYVQFSMDKETVGSIMFDANGQEITDKLLLDNVVEINSYSTYKDNKLYAGIDKDSKPGNAVPGDRNTYEDDTDAAPALQLVVANARKITGTVFLDGTSAELRTGEERLGDGEFKEGETTISGVAVKMLKEDGTEVASATTDENGNFELTGFMPGNYTIVYTWGNETYTVKDYKGTIYKEPSRSDNTKWYQTTTPRYSDAIDNYDTRKSIDSGAEITTMDSTTPTMNFGIEMFDKNAGGTIDITPGIDKVEFVIPNVDFGIVERARQQLDVSKRATAVKITLADGQVIVDATVEDGQIKGSAIKGVTYGPASETTDGFLKTEMDNELIQGATIQIEYTITVANNSELDYDSENYYKFGIPGGNKVTIKPEGVYDYLDSEMVLDSNKESQNAGWETKTTTEYNTTVSEPTIIEKYLYEYSSNTVDKEGYITTIKGYESFEEQYSEAITNWSTTTIATAREKRLADKTILYNANLENSLEPGGANTVKLYTSKVLSNTDEIDLNNDVEITKVERKTQTGREVTPKTSPLYDRAEIITVTPPTGDNQDYIIPIVLGISTLIILGAGVILIKNKVLK